MNTGSFHVYAGWIGMLCGALTGAVIGLYFHDETWAGGYASFRRRMLRLGHISFFGIGFLNLLFGLTLLQAAALPPPYLRIASAGFLVAMVTMPLTCFLSAWKKPLRHLFPVPVLAVLAGILPLLIAWPRS